MTIAVSLGISLPLFSAEDQYRDEAGRFLTLIKMSATKRLSARTRFRVVSQHPARRGIHNMSLAARHTMNGYEIGLRAGLRIIGNPTLHTDARAGASKNESGHSRVAEKRR